MLPYPNFVFLICLSYSSYLFSAPDQRKPMLPDQVPFELGAGFIADSRAFSELAHVGNARGKSESGDVEMIKFVADIQPQSGINLYWINTKNINMHPLFLQKIGLASDFGGRGKGDRNGKGRKDGGRGKGDDRTEELAVRKRGEQASRMGGGKQIRTLEAYSANSTSVILRGDMTYLADERADSGKQGVFIFNLEPRVPPELASVVFKQINKTLPISEGRLAYQVPEETYLSQKQAFNKAGVKLYSDFEKFIALNQGSGIGKLRYLEEDILKGDSLAAQVYRGLFIRQILMQIDKYKLYNVYKEGYFNQVN